MNTKLITALRTAAKALEEGTFRYDWNHMENCNCGVLVCALLGTSPSELVKLIPPAPLDEDTANTWKNAVGQFCPITGTPTHLLFKKLFSFGLTASDIVDLEYMENIRVLARMDFRHRRWRWFAKIRSDYKDPAFVSAYLRAWADLLTEEGALDVPTSEPVKQEQPA